jgi:hypothetical protein
MTADAIVAISAAVVACVQLIKWAGLRDSWGPIAVIGFSGLGVLIWLAGAPVWPPVRTDTWPIFAGWVAVALSAAGVLGFTGAGASAVISAKPPPGGGAGSSPTVDAEPVADIHPDMTPQLRDQLVTLVRELGPTRALSTLNDEQYRSPHHEAAPSAPDPLEPPAFLRRPEAR